MTLHNITTDRIREIERLLTDATETLSEIRVDAARGRITVKEAADKLNRIGAKLNKAIYPENHE